jgi:uncharacterized protein YdaU (DUF1376 family)
MAKNPILPLYYNDLLGATKTWTDEEFGAYVRLLIEQWDKGGLPNDYQRLTRIATSLGNNWEGLLRDKFPLVDGMLKNPVMESVRAKRAKFSELQADRVRKRYRNSTEVSTKNLPVENENENENEKVIERKEVQEGTIDTRLDAALVDTYLEPLLMNGKHLYPGVDINLELARFRQKVKGSPRVYAEHDTGGLRLAFEHQLRNAKPTIPNGKPKVSIKDFLADA